MLQSFLNRANQDQPVYLCQVRDAFIRAGQLPFTCRVTLYDGTARHLPLPLPPFAEGEESAFVAAYLHAALYNILSALGAVRIDLYLDMAHPPLRRLAESVNEVFQTALPKAQRTGYGKCLNVNERILRALRGGGEPFRFCLHDASEEPASPPPQPARTAGGVFAKLPAAAADKLVMGMDVGGTDIKLVASVCGELKVFKEYDWFPPAFTTAEEMIDPLLLLTRVMRAAASLAAAGREDQMDRAALDRHASQRDMLRGAEAMERAAGTALRNFDAIGLSFPDVVIRNRIVGGESPKTVGMRDNKAIDYEVQLSKLTGLSGRLEAYVRPGGPVLIVNDGPMAAFTTAVEQAAIGRSMTDGFFAHTLGTDLGTGWVLPDGSIPEIPLEVYNFIVDLGSFPQRRYEADDVRSVNNFGTHLPGTLQKYAGQSGVFRLAAKELPDKSPALWQAALDRGFFVWQGDQLSVPVEPNDLRKPCLEFLMDQASQDETCAGIFRQVGEALGACWAETEYILSPEAKDRTLFGRLVKDAACFRLIREGARQMVPGLRLHTADSSLANTTLMKQLACHPDYTVAQFAQAVGAVFYACLPLV